MKLKVLFVAVLIMASCAKNKKQESGTETTKEVETTKEKETPLEVYDFNGFEKFLNQKDDKIHVVNFWATWCAPCVKELPYFEQLNDTYKDENVEVLLVSLDFPHMYDSKLKPFIKDRKLKSKVVALDDPDMNTWIPKVNEAWSGSIPATVIYNKNKSVFFEQSFTFDELEKEVKQFLN
ncbi:TlpA disulfide reductase family protein [Tamlana sp. 2_MG-2023]|uniref:TlpA disulfide reductase family protein n=1 Tax=unclassified Tamlana TaxID=2614803 RepID=UPI0026E25823|nr:MULTISPECIES: TlpA disulfide reductase family protein [unclassified Tamlana]MDO6758652.1 TlpA disulfide reductase family protein [Tamlana sp. 2_MG-2023]MDO6789351.1 TlpA disulfide reductase family protein [Tamlana sp. 1_MG-2023]